MKTSQQKDRSHDTSGCQGCTISSVRDNGELWECLFLLVFSCLFCVIYAGSAAGQQPAAGVPTVRASFTLDDLPALTKSGQGDGVVNYHAVVCGVENYPGTSSDLTYCADDAEDFAAMLLQWPNWDTANVTLLINSAVTQSGVHQAIQAMGQNADADDVCVFFFSGHGTFLIDKSPYDETDGFDEYLVTYDGLAYDWYWWEYIATEDCISDDELGNWMGDLPTTNYIVFLDSCFSGGAIKGLMTESVKGIGGMGPQKNDGFAADFTGRVMIKDLDDNNCGVVVLACDDDETCVESPLLAHGAFTHYLLKGMAGESDANCDGQISAEECYEYVRQRASYINPDQHAQIYDGHDGELGFLGESQNITVTSPHRYSCSALGETLTIRWVSKGNQGAGLDIELCRGGTPILTIASCVEDSGSHDWTLPGDAGLTGAPDYQIKITACSGISLSGQSEYFCITTPPDVEDVSLWTYKDAVTTIQLAATDEGRPNPPGALTYTIASLPVHGTLNDPDAGPIARVPTALVNGGNLVVYTPDGGYAGPDEFAYIANDGGFVPAGGDSMPAKVAIEVLDCTSITIGSGSATWSYPMHTYFHDSRTQVVYLANEIGPSGQITALGLDVDSVPGQVLENWTIRMKHTSESSYSTAALEPDGWTVVYQGHEPSGISGWRIFEFSQPFAYNGTDNLMVDFSHNNRRWTSNGTCRCSLSEEIRSVYAYSDSTSGDPLTWSGNTSPTVRGSNNVPNLQLIVSPTCFPSTYSTYNDWVAMGKPNCWCSPYQCDGDVDGIAAGFSSFYRVFTGDLSMLIANWKRKIDDVNLNPCADIDHKPQGIGKYRVFTDDLTMLVTNWKKTDKDLPGNCPRPE